MMEPEPQFYPGVCMKCGEDVLILAGVPPERAMCVPCIYITHIVMSNDTCACNFCLRWVDIANKEEVNLVPNHNWN